MVIKEEKVPTGIKGLDKLIAGGFERGSAVLVAAGGGSGKSIFATQFLVEGMQNNETGIYISFEENKDRFYRHMLVFGWDLQKFESEGRFIFLKYSHFCLKI